MASLESAYFAVEQLAKDFKANENHYLRPEYSESQTRIDFIDKSAFISFNLWVLFLPSSEFIPHAMRGSG